MLAWAPCHSVLWQSRHGGAALASFTPPRVPLGASLPYHAAPTLFLHCSAIKTPVPPGAKLPQIVVQMPVYKESLEEVSSSLDCHLDGLRGEAGSLSSNSVSVPCATGSV